MRGRVEREGKGVFSASQCVFFPSSFFLQRVLENYLLTCCPLYAGLSQGERKNDRWERCILFFLAIYLREKRGGAVTLLEVST